MVPSLYLLRKEMFLCPKCFKKILLGTSTHNIRDWLAPNSLNSFAEPMEQERIESSSCIHRGGEWDAVVSVWTGIYVSVGPTLGSTPGWKYPTCVNPLKEMACFHTTKNTMQKPRGPLTPARDPRQPQFRVTYLTPHPLSPNLDRVPGVALPSFLG